jgi:hypothetical protein
MPTPSSFPENIRLLRRTDFSFTLVEMTASLNLTIKNQHGQFRNLLKTDGSLILESDTKAR